MNDNTIGNLRAVVNAGFERVGTALGLAATAIAALVKKEPTPQATAVARGELNQNGVAKTASKHQYKKVDYEKLDDQKYSFTMTKVDRKGKEIVKNYVFNTDDKIGEGGMGTAYKLREVDKNGQLTHKIKVLKIAHDRDDARVAMTSGDAAMKGQHVGPKGKPTHIPGIIKPTKFVDETSYIAITTLYELGDMNHVKLNTPKECFDFVGQTLFGLNHMHSKFEPKINFMDKIRAMLGLKVKNRHFEGKESIVHRDIKPGNILCTEKNGKKQYVLMDFDGAHITGRTDTNVTRTIDHTHLLDDLMIGTQQDESDLQKKIDIYALGLSFRETITKQKINDIVEDVEDRYGNEGCRIKHDLQDNRILMKPTDVPGFNNFSIDDKNKMMKLINLINQMTDDDYTKRSSAEASLAALKAVGIEVPQIHDLKVLT